MALLSRSRFLLLLTASLTTPLVAFDTNNINWQANHTQEQIASLPIGKHVVRPELASQTTSLAQQRGKYHDQTISGIRDLRSGSLRVLRLQNREGTKNSGLTREGILTTALEFLHHDANVLNVNVEQLFLIRNSLLITPDVQSLSYGLKRDGLVVTDAQLTLHFKKGAIVQVINNLFAEAKPVPFHNYDENDLRSFAKSALKVQNLDKKAEFFRVKALPSGGYQLVHVLEFEGVVDEVPYRIQIDTLEHSVFEVSPTYFYANGSAEASIYPRWYGESLVKKPLKELKVTDHVYTNDLGRFDISDDSLMQNKLIGTRVNVIDKSRPVYLESLQSFDNTGDWLLSYNRDPKGKWSQSVDDDRMTSQAMIYYHVTEIAELAEKYIPDTFWLKIPLEAHANVGGLIALGGCNAFWNGTSINLFNGSWTCANTGLIADVIYHEWGHGLDQNTGGLSDRAFSEGFGDIMAMIMTESHEIGKGFYKITHRPIRDIEANAVYKPFFLDFLSDPHALGLVIASTYWDLYTDLTAMYGHDRGLDMIRNFAFKMIYLAPRYTDAYNAVLVIDDDDQSLDNGTPNFCLINKVFSLHGLAKIAETCPNEKMP